MRLILSLSFVIIVSGLASARSLVGVWNEMADIKETLRFVANSDMTRNKWDFMPLQFNFSDTNAMYEAELVPMRARPLRIELTFDKTVKAPPPWRLLRGARFKMSVIHCSDGKLLGPIEQDGGIAGYSYPKHPREDVLEMTVPLCRSSDFPWFYKDKIRIRVELSRPPDVHERLPSTNVFIRVSEYYPFE